MAKEVNRRVNVFINGKEVENNIKSIRAAMSHLTNQLAKMDRGSAEYNQTLYKLAKLRAIYDDHTKSIKDATSAISNMSKANKENAESFGEVKNEIEAASKTNREILIVAGAASSALQGAHSAYQKVISSVKEYIEAFSTLDEAMTNVSKYTGLSKNEVEALNEALQKIDTRTPIEKLNALAADAGRLGITSQQAIQDFVEAGDIINVSLGEDLGEDAVKNIGKMAQMFGESDTLGLRGAMIATASAVNSLGQSSSASEPYIMEFTSRLAGVANTAGITQANIMGIASAMDQNMGQVERSSTAVQKVLMDMMSKTEQYADLVGMTSDEFKKLVDSDMNAAFLSVLDALNSISQQGGSALAQTLSDLKLKGSGVQDTLMTLAKKTDQLREAQANATAAYADGKSVLNEYAAANNNAAAELEKQQNQINIAKANLGKELYPIYLKLINATLVFSNKTVSLVKHLKAHSEILILIGALFAKKIKYYSLLTMKQIAHTAAKVKDIVVTKAHAVATNLSTIRLAAECIAHDVATKKIKIHRAALEMLNIVMKKTPWGLITAGIATAVTGIIALTKHTRESKAAIKDVNKEISDNSAGSISLLKKLSQQYAQLGDDLQAKEKFINDNKSAFEQLGVSIRSVTDAENLFIANKDKFVKSLLERAKAAAYQKRAEEIMQSNIEKTQPLQDQLDDVNKKIEAARSKLIETNDPQEFIEKNGALVQELDGLYNVANSIQRKISEINKDAEDYIRRQIQLESDADRIFKEGGFSSFSYDNTDGSNGSTGNYSSSTKTDPIADFEKKLADFRKRQQNASLEGWAKTKQGIIDSYQEMIDKANNLNQTETAKGLETERDNAIKKAGQKYLRSVADMMVKFREQAESLNKGDEESPLMKAIAGTEKEWNEKITQLKLNMETLQGIIDDMHDDDDQKNALQGNLDYMAEQYVQSTALKAAAVSNTIKKFTKDTDDFILAEQKEMDKANFTDLERQKLAIEEKYDLEIKKIQEVYDARAAKDANDPELANLQAQIKQLKEMKVMATGRARGNNIWENLLNIDWKNFKDNWRDNLQTMTAALQEFANAAFDIFNSINQIQSNRENAAFDEWCEIQDKKADTLQRQLDDGIISQKYYDAQMAKMEKEKEAKEKKIQHDQFEREKKANIIQATINGALAIVTAFAQLGPVAGAIAAVLTAATTAAEIAVIASQPNPYAKGGYIRKEQIALMGEEGQEWVASNRLLTDRKTAPLIAALEDYQRGNSRALEALSLAQPDWNGLSQSAKNISTTFAGSNAPVVNNYNSSTDNSEVLKELKQMNAYLKDPKNRQAYISRKMQLEFDRQENELKAMARL